jgi:DNA topoisomerase-6 subunit B
MYGQLTTGKPVVIVSKIGKGRPAWRLEVRIDARTNNPEVLNKDQSQTVPWEKEHGTAVEIELTGLYRGGRTSVDAYLEQTVVANPHLELTYKPPRGNPVHYPRVSDKLPPEAHEIKPHPHGVELGMLIKILHEAGNRTVRTTLMEEFSRVTGHVADELCQRAGVDPERLAPKLHGPEIEAIHAVMVSSHAALPPPKKFSTRLAKSDDTVREEVMTEGTGFSQGLADAIIRRAGFEPNVKAKLVTPSQVEKLYESLHGSQVKILPPPATCVVPVGEELIMEGLKRRFKADFFVSHTRPPAVYRGNPFVVEAGVAFGGSLPNDETAEIMRFANRVPLQYQPKACAISESIYDTNWRAYELQQPKGGLPVGPLAVVVHLASVWVPFTSEAKEAVAHYDEIVKEIRQALMECGRKLGNWVRAQESQKWELERKTLFEKYIKELAASIHEITGVPELRVAEDFQSALTKHVKIAAPPESPEAAEAAAVAVEGAESVETTDGSEPNESPVVANDTAETRRASDAPPPLEVATSAVAESVAANEDDDDSPPPDPVPAPKKKSKAKREKVEAAPEAEEPGFGSAFEDVTPGKTRKFVAREEAAARVARAR